MLKLSRSAALIKPSLVPNSLEPSLRCGMMTRALKWRFPKIQHDAERRGSKRGGRSLTRAAHGTPHALHRTERGEVEAGRRSSQTGDGVTRRKVRGIYLQSAGDVYSDRAFLLRYCLLEAVPGESLQMKLEQSESSLFTSVCAARIDNHRLKRYEGESASVLWSLRCLWGTESK